MVVRTYISVVTIKKPAGSGSILVRGLVSLSVQLRDARYGYLLRSYYPPPWTAADSFISPTVVVCNIAKDIHVFQKFSLIVLFFLQEKLGCFLRARFHFLSHFCGKFYRNIDTC